MLLVYTYATSWSVRGRIGLETRTHSILDNLLWGEDVGNRYERLATVTVVCCSIVRTVEG